MRVFSALRRAYSNYKRNRWLNKISKNVKVGKFTYGVNQETFLIFRDTDRVSIGHYCSFALGVKIVASGEHNYGAVSSFPFYAYLADRGVEKDTFSKGEVRIGNDVWLGARSTVLSGVRISDGAVVAAGAVVTKDVPPYAIVAGVPAQIIKYRFSEQNIKKLLAISWWDWDPEFIKSNLDDFYMGIDSFVDKYFDQ